MTNPAFTTPNQTDFGYDFNYASWTEDTVITLTNVPWNNDYRDIVKFPNRGALDSYINSKATTNTRIDDSSYARVNMPIRLDIPFNKAYGYNYLRAANPAMPIPGSEAQSFYYFILDVRYVAPNTTEIVVQLDIWQSFGFDITFGSSFVERGHIGIANQNQFENYGRNYLTMPEGIDTGGEYRVIDTRQEDVVLTFGTDAFAILVASTIDLEADAGTVTDPKVVAANGGTISMLPSGASYYVFADGTSFSTYLNSIRDTPWVSQGIISITLIPRITRYFSGFSFNASGTPTRAPTNVPTSISHNMFANWRDILINKIPAKYRHLKKFLTSPYMVIEMTTWSGTPIVIKPESWNNAHAQVTERANIVPPAQRIMFMPFGYNADTVAVGGPGNDDGGEYLDFATLIQSFPTVAIVNNMASNYLAANANMVAFQNQSADWAQQRALAGSQTAYDQASSNIDLAYKQGVTASNADIAQTQLGNNALGASALMNSIGGVAGGAASGMVGGPAGAAIGSIGSMAGGIMGNLNAMHQQRVNNDSLSIRNTAAIINSNNQLNNSQYIRDTNKSLATFAARGDYENTIAGINAKVQDSKFTQPTTSGQVGGDAMNLIHLTMELNLRWKLLDAAHLRSVGDYWLRYGYAVSQFTTIPESLMVMSKFTYWKLTETYIQTGNLPESYKQGIRGLFEKGVTVWANPNDIGMIDWADNVPLEGITL